MTGHWQCGKCQSGRVKSLIAAVGGGIKEARQVACEDCGESDSYTIDLLSRENPPRTEQGKFRWVKQEAQSDAG